MIKRERNQPDESMVLLSSKKRIFKNRLDTRITLVREHIANIKSIVRLKDRNVLLVRIVLYRDIG